MNKRKAKSKGWTVAIIVFGVATGIALGRGPWLVYGEQREKADQARAEMRRLEKQRTDLVSDKARYESDLGREQLAREMGYKKPGETSALKDPR